MILPCRPPLNDEGSAIGCLPACVTGSPRPAGHQAPRPGRGRRRPTSPTRRRPWAASSRAAPGRTSPPPCRTGRPHGRLVLGVGRTVVGEVDDVPTREHGRVVLGSPSEPPGLVVATRPSGRRRPQSSSPSVTNTDLLLVRGAVDQALARSGEFQLSMPSRWRRRSSTASSSGSRGMTGIGCSGLRWLSCRLATSTPSPGMLCLLMSGRLVSSPTVRWPWMCMPGSPSGSAASVLDRSKRSPGQRCSRNSGLGSPEYGPFGSTSVPPLLMFIGSTRGPGSSWTNGE